MKPSLILTALLGFSVGGYAAWRVAAFPGKSSAPIAVTQAVDRPQGPPGGGSDVIQAWQALQAGGGQGMAGLFARSELISRASTSEMPRLLMLTDGDPLLKEMLLRRWAVLDPAGAAEWALPAKITDKWKANDKDIGLVFSVWAQKDPVAALARLRANAPAGEARFWSGNILDRLFEVDMAAGVKFGALAGPNLTLGFTSYREASSAWIEKAPEKAATLLSTLPPGEFRDKNLIKAMEVLAKKDLAAAIALQEQYPTLQLDSGQRGNRSGFFSAWAAKDPAALTDFLNGKAEEIDRPAIKSALAQAMAEKDPRAALDWSAANLSGRNRSEVVNDILEKLTKANPQAALGYLDSLSAGTALESAVETFSKALTGDDPGALLLSQAGSLPDGAARKSLTAKAYEKMYEKDPDGLLKTLASQPAASLPDGIWSQLGGKSGSIADGMKHLDAVPPEEATEFVRGLFQSHIGKNDGLAKFTEAMATLTVPEQRAAAIEAGVRQQLWRGAGAVTDWAKSLPPAERGLVADQIEQHSWNLTPAQKREWIDPLRAHSAP